MIGLALGGLALLAALGGGAALLDRAAPALLARPAGWAWALGVGVGAHALLVSALAAVGALGPGTAAGVLALLGAGWALRPAVRAPALPGGAAAAAIALFLAPAVLAALAPPTDTDELYQHLALARRIAEGGGFLGGFDTPDGSRPQVVHAVLAAQYALGGAVAARGWHLGLAVALPLAAGELGEARFGAGRGLVPALVLVASYTYAHEAGLAYNDIPAAWWLLLGVEAALAGLAGPAGAFLGLALAAKYTAAPAAAMAGLVLLGRSDRRARDFAVAAAAGLLPLAPWWVRNGAAGLHPLFPYAGWPAVTDFRFVYPEKYGVGHTWLDAARLPFDVIFRARIDSFVYLGQLSWGWLGLGLGAVWGAWRSRDARALVLVAAAGFVGWGASAQVLRYLLPLAGVAVYAGAAAPWRWPTVMLLLLSLPKNAAPLWEESAAKVAVVTGAEAEDAWLDRELPAWGALRYLRDHAPPDEPVALLYAWHGYYVQQPYLLGSVEDHTPTRQWLAEHGDDALRALARRGVRWLLVGDLRFLRKSYAFLPEADWRAQFVEPRDRLRTLLLRDAERLHAAAHWEVYRLDAPAVGE